MGQRKPVIIPTMRKKATLLFPEREAMAGFFKFLVYYLEIIP
jgi:hypothetical protein